MKIQLLVDNSPVWESAELVGLSEAGYEKERDEIEGLISENDYDGYTLDLVGGTDADKEVFNNVGCIDDLKIGGVLYMMWKLGQQNDNRMHAILLEVHSDGNLCDNDEIETAINNAEADDTDNFGQDDHAYAYGTGDTEEEARAQCAEARHYYCLMSELGPRHVNWAEVATVLHPLRTHTWGGKYHVLDYVINPAQY